MSRRLKISPRKLPPLSPEKVKDAEDEVVEALLWDVRCLVYQHLTASQLLAHASHAIFPELLKCVREVVMDVVVAPEFLAQFPKLQKVSGPFIGKSEDREFVNVGDVHLWAPLIRRGVEIDHVAFEHPHVPEDASQQEKGEHTAKLREIDTLGAILAARSNPNFAWHAGIKDKGRDSDELIYGIFDGGILLGEKFVMRGDISKMWIEENDLLWLWKPAIWAGHPDNVDRDVDDANKQGANFKEVGVSYHVWKLIKRKYPNFSLKIVKANYKSKKYPLVFDDLLLSELK